MKEDKTIEKGIPKEKAGKFRGYTLGRDEPTLYFEKGRYTQEYPEDANIGWHPNSQHYRGSNINKDAYDLIMSIPVESPPSIEEVEFINKFLKGDYDSDAADAKFFECQSKDGKVWSAHPSSSKLIKTTDLLFDETYDDTYVDTVLENGVLAPNECR